MQIAILTQPRGSAPHEVMTALTQMGLDVLDFSWDMQHVKVLEAKAFVLIVDSHPVESEAAAQPLISLLREEASLGKPILGLGRGAAALLANSGLIPGLYQNWVGLKVAPCHKEEGEIPWLRLSKDYQLNAFTQGLSPDELLPLRGPIEAQFIIPDGLLLELQEQGQTVFLFCDKAGNLLPHHPIAAVSDKAGRILAFLADPEMLTLERLFKALRTYLQTGFQETVSPLYYWPRK